MAGLGDLIDTYVSDPLRKLLGSYVPEEGPTELPTAYDTSSGRHEVDPFEGFRRSTKPSDLPENIPAYRADERSGGIETLPQARFDARSPLKSDVNFWQAVSADKKTITPHIRDMYAYARVAGAAQALGLPSVGPDQFAAMVLKEGRPDAGFNAFIPSAKPDLEFRKRLDQYNIPEWQKDYLGMLNYADRISKAKKVPFEAVWNGLGRSADTGKTGYDYAEAVKAHQQAVLHPKNTEFRNFVHRAFSDGTKFGLPLVTEKARDTDPYLVSDPEYKYHYPDGRLKAAGGIVIDDGNPAKRRKLI